MRPRTILPKVDVSYAEGKHQLKFGFSYNRYTKNQMLYGDAQGDYQLGDQSGDTLMDVLMGIPTVFSQNQPGALAGGIFNFIFAFKLLMRAHNDGTSPLPNHILQSIIQPEVLVYEGSNPNIAWILQGLRHMTGVKEWQPLQQAEFLAMVEAEIAGRKGKKTPALPTVAKEAGVPLAKASRLLNAYYALQQATEDEDYGDAPDVTDSFGIFSEGVFKKTSLYQDWLGWDNETRKFTDRKT